MTARTISHRYEDPLDLVWRRALDNASAGWTSKGVPILNSIRLVLRAGLPALLVLCVGWQVLSFVDAHAWRLAVDLLGAHDWREWRVLANPVSLLVNGPLSLRPALATRGRPFTIPGTMS